MPVSRSCPAQEEVAPGSLLPGSPETSLNSEVGLEPHLEETEASNHGPLTEVWSQGHLGGALVITAFWESRDGDSGLGI